MNVTAPGRYMPAPMVVRPGLADHSEGTQDDERRRQCRF
jgi:hypothetical protein